MHGLRQDRKMTGDAAEVESERDRVPRSRLGRPARPLATGPTGRHGLGADGCDPGCDVVRSGLPSCVGSLKATDGPGPIRLSPDEAARGAGVQTAMQTPGRPPWPLRCAARGGRAGTLRRGRGQQEQVARSAAGPPEAGLDRAAGAAGAAGSARVRGPAHQDRLPLFAAIGDYNAEFIHECAS